MTLPKLSVEHGQSPERMPKRGFTQQWSEPCREHGRRNCRPCGLRRSEAATAWWTKRNPYGERAE